MRLSHARPGFESPYRNVIFGIFFTQCDAQTKLTYLGLVLVSFLVWFHSKTNRFEQWQMAWRNSIS